MASNILKTQIAQQTNNEYLLDFDKIKVSILKEKIDILNLNLRKQNTSDTTNSSQYEVSVDRIEIDLRSIKSIYFDKELHVEGIKIYDPHVRIVKDGKQVKTNFSLETGSIYNAISDYLSLFSVSEFKLMNGAIHFEKTNGKKPFDIKVDSIDFSVANFLIDSTGADSSKFLFTDKIELIITNQIFQLPDSIHNVSFEEFHISTKTGDILFKNLKLQPDEKVDIETLENYMDVSMSEFNLRGLDFNEAYQANHLLLDSVRILNPNIIMHGKKKKSNGKKQLDLLALSSKMFDEIKIKKLYLDDANLDITSTAGPQLAQYRSPRMNLVISNIVIDSTHSIHTDWTQVFETVDIHGEQFFAHIMDSSHTIHIDQINYSNRQAILNFKDLKIHPTSDQIEADDPKVNVEVHSLESTGLSNLYNIIHGRLRMSALTVDQPNINLVLPREKGESNKGQKSSYLQYINIDKLALRKGDMDIFINEDEVNLTDLDIKLNSLKFKPEDLQNFLFHRLTKISSIKLGTALVDAEKIKLELSDLHLHNWTDLKAKNLYVHPATVPEPFKFNSIRVTAFDIDHFLHNQLLAFDTLIVDRPVLHLYPGEHQEANKQNLVNWAHHTEFKEVKVTNGQLTKHSDSSVQVHLENFDAELTYFHYDSIHDEYHTHIGYRGDSLYLNLEKIKHEVTGKDISISIKDSTLDIKTLQVRPQVKEGNQFNISTHEFKLRRIDFHKLINDQQVHFYNGYVLTPSIDLSIYSENKEEKKQLPRDLIKFHSLNVSNGSVHFENHKKDSSLIADLAHINVLINEFDLGRDSTIFSAKNYLADIEGVVLRQFGKEDSVTVRKAFVNTRAGHIKVNDLKLQPNPGTKVSFPLIDITGFDPELFAHTNQVAIDTLLIKEPTFALDLDNSDSESKQKKNNALPTLKIKNIKVANAQGELTKDGVNFSRPIALNEINLSIDSVQIDSTSTTMDLAQHLRSTRLSLKDFVIATPDSLYDFKVSKIDFSGSDNQIHITGIKLDPYHNKRQFQRYVDYQKDWLDMEIKRLTIINPDLLRLISDQFLDIDKIDIDAFSLDTHRDKRLPWPPAQYKPLPQELIAGVELPFNIDKIELNNSYVSHSEYSPTGNLPGDIFFNNLNAVITNITNDPELLKTKPIMKFDAKGVLMHTGNFQVTVDFDLADTTQFFYFEGNLKNMDLTELNRLLEHTAFVHIRDGYNKNVVFNFEANNDYAVGTMKFYYNDLKISVLNPDNLALKGHGASIKSFFANTFVVSKKNPHFIFVREGDIFHHRDENRAIFNYWAKALLSGVVSSIGAKNNKKEIRQLNEEMKKELDEKRARTLKKLESQEKAANK